MRLEPGRSFMRAAVALLVVAGGLVLSCAPVKACAPEDSSRSAACACGSELVPKWRINVQAFDIFDDGTLLGVYRRVGGRTDLGVNLGTSFDATGGEGDATWLYDDHERTHSTDDEDRFSVSLGADLRRWHRLTPRLSWFTGLRLTGSHSRDEGESVDHVVSDAGPGSSHTHSTDRTFGIALALGGGVDLALLQHLSVSFSLSPITLAETWAKSTDTYFDDQPGASEIRERNMESTTDRFSVDTSLKATAYLSLGF
jgi:hypothetical protein